MTTDGIAQATARYNARHGEPTSPTIVRALLETIDRLERAAELLEED